MLARFLALLALMAPIVLGDVQFTSPAAGISLTVSGATVKISAAWKDSGDDPPLADLATYSLYLYAGGNSAGTYVCHPSRVVSTKPFFEPGADCSSLLQQQIGSPLATGETFSAGSTVSGSVASTAGADIDNA